MISLERFDYHQELEFTLPVCFWLQFIMTIRWFRSYKVPSDHMISRVLPGIQTLC